MALSKRTRFEIFKRDGFTCQYCGQRPPDVILEVDHIDPSSKGGSDEEINLITSCFACNRGKSDRKLGDIHPRPDADMKFLETQQEIAEAKRYLGASEEKALLRGQICEKLSELWEELISEVYVPTRKMLGGWLTNYEPTMIEKAISITSLAYQKGKFNGEGGLKNKVESAISYTGGVLYHIANPDQGNKPCQKG